MEARLGWGKGYICSYILNKFEANWFSDFQGVTCFRPKSRAKIAKTKDTLVITVGFLGGVFFVSDATFFQYSTTVTPKWLSHLVHLFQFRFHSASRPRRRRPDVEGRVFRPAFSKSVLQATEEQVLQDQEGNGGAF